MTPFFDLFHDHGYRWRVWANGAGRRRCRSLRAHRNRSPPPRMKMVRFPWKLRSDCTWLTVLCPRMPLYDPGDTPTSENQRGWCACRSPARAIGVNPALDPRFSPCPRQTTVASCPRDLWRVRRSGVCVSSVVGTFAHFMAPCLVCSMRFCTLLSLVCALFQLFIACPSPEDDTRYVAIMMFIGSTLNKKHV